MSHGPYSSSQSDGITVVELDEGDGQNVALFSSLLEAYQGQGYHRGYRRATADILSSLFMLTEEYLRSRPHADPQLRKTLYDFQGYLETFLGRPDEKGFVSEGLGI